MSDAETAAMSAWAARDSMDSHLLLKVNGGLENWSIASTKAAVASCVVERDASYDSAYHLSSVTHHLNHRCRQFDCVWVDVTGICLIRSLSIPVPCRACCLKQV